MHHVKRNAARLRRIDDSPVTRGAERVQAVAQQDHDSPLTRETSAAVEGTNRGRSAQRVRARLLADAQLSLSRSLSCRERIVAPPARFRMRSNRSSMAHARP